MRMKWVGHIALRGEMRITYKILVRKTQGKRPLERRRCRWEDNIKRDLVEIRCTVVNWTELVQNKGHFRAFINTAMNLRI